MAVGLLSEYAFTGPRSVGHTRIDGGLCWRWLVAECLSAMLLVSVAVAYASPPAPSWATSIYDHRDNDDVVRMVTNATGVSNAQPSQPLEPILAGFVLDAATPRLPNPTARRHAIRGPPIEARDVSIDIDLLLVSLIFLPCPWLSGIRRSRLTSLAESDRSSALAYLASHRHAPTILPTGPNVGQSAASRHGQAEDTRGAIVKIIVMTPVRLLGDALAACLRARPEMAVLAIENDLASLRDALATTGAQIVLVDVTQGIDLFEVRAIAVKWSDVAMVALGLNEQRQEVIRCGRAGFAGYVPRHASIDALCQALSDIVAGRLACPPDISGGLLRALFRRDPRPDEPELDPALTKRESEVLLLLGRGLSNKEIGSELSLSVPTVKHHVHHILEKLQLSRRTQAMRRVRDAPWIAPTSSQENRK